MSGNWCTVLFGNVANPHTDTNVYTLTHTATHISRNTRIHTWARTYIYTHEYTNRSSQTEICIWKWTHIYICIYTQVWIHPYIYKHTQLFLVFCSDELNKENNSGNCLAIWLGSWKFEDPLKFQQYQISALFRNLCLNEQISFVFLNLFQCLSQDVIHRFNRGNIVISGLVLVFLL